ncbi:MAG: hypothetical protein AABY32_01465 [Nanoarchaeota archaeon]
MAKEIIKNSPKEKEFAIQCFIDGQRVQTHKLNKEEAANFIVTAKHLIDYLSKEYGIEK